MEEKEKVLDRDQIDDDEDPVFRIEEISIEEMAIDGICGVY